MELKMYFNDCYKHDAPMGVDKQGIPPSAFPGF
jgi:hypothetical protein